MHSRRDMARRIECGFNEPFDNDIRIVDDTGTHDPDVAGALSEERGKRAKPNERTFKHKSRRFGS